MPYSLGILGAGNMAEAIARGVLSAKLFLPAQIIASDPSDARRQLFLQQLQIEALDDNAAAVRQSRIVLLSVKPQHMAEVLASISAVVSKDALFISIAAGKSSAFIERHLGPAAPWRIIRAMPNTPMLVGEGMVALCRGRHASADDLQIARQLFQTSAAVIDVDEDKMDAVTAMSGSGPAYFFYLVEQMIAAGISLGLTPEQSHTLATRTALGAAKMLTSSADSPRELRKKVTSPGGTTQAAIETMEAQHVNEAIVAAIRRAAERGRELAG